MSKSKVRCVAMAEGSRPKHFPLSEWLLDNMPPRLLNPELLEAYFDLLSQNMGRIRAAMHLHIPVDEIQSALLLPEFVAACERYENKFVYRCHKAVSRCIEGGEVVSRHTRRDKDGGETISETFTQPDGKLAMRVLESLEPERFTPKKEMKVSIQELTTDQLLDLAAKGGIEVDQ